MDYLSLYITAKIMHTKFKGKAMTLGAIVGALYSLVIIALNINNFTVTLMSILVSVIMVLTAFGKQKPLIFVKNTAVFYVVSFSLGGGITAICNLLNVWQNSRGIVINGTFDTLYGDLPFGLLVIVGLICSVFSLISGKIIKRNTDISVCELEICINNNKINLRSLVDSGNLLREPISGKPVIIITFEKIRPILPMEMLNCVKNNDMPSENLTFQSAKIRFIPTSTVGGNGLLVALIADSVTINGTETDTYIAIDKKQKSFGEYSAIVPSSLIQ